MRMRKLLGLLVVLVSAVLAWAPTFADPPAAGADVKYEVETQMTLVYKNGQWSQLTEVIPVSAELVFWGEIPEEDPFGLSIQIQDASGDIVATRAVGQFYTDAGTQTLCANVNFSGLAPEQQNAATQYCQNSAPQPNGCYAHYTCPDNFIWLIPGGSCIRYGLMNGDVCACRVPIPSNICEGHGMGNGNPQAGLAPGLFDSWFLEDYDDADSVALAPCGANSPYDRTSGECEGQAPCVVCDPDPTNNGGGVE